MKDYLHEIPKETLTTKNIKQDIKQKYKINIGAVMALGIISLLIMWCANGLFKDTKVLAIFYGIGGLLLFISSIIMLFYPLIGRNIASKKLVIVEDWLVEIKEKIEHTGKHARAYYEFCFAKGGKYRLYMNTAYSFDNNHYKWSKMYNMNNQGIYNYSHIDDDFYLVFSNEKKNNLLLIYNKKLFDFKDI